MMAFSSFLRFTCLFQGVTAVLVRNTETAPPILTVTTAIPSATASDNVVLPSQADLPPEQPWCPSEVFCPGSVSVFYLIVREIFFSKLPHILPVVAGCEYRSPVS